MIIMYVHAVSPFICDPVEDLSVLKEDLKKYTDFFFRRANKFILLSLLGVHRCIMGREIHKSTGVYLATENGNLGDTENVLYQLYDAKSLPKPFNFINTMSNTASFYVAQSLKSLGRSITVSSKHVSFERGLELAKVDFDLGHVREALVGGVDEAISFRDHFKAKYDASYHGLKLVEGSSWLYLKSDKSGAMGEITGIKTCAAIDDALEYTRGAAENPCLIFFGIHITPGEKDIWMKECPVQGELDYLGTHGFYDPAASFAVSSFLESGAEKSLIHINRNLQGQYVVLTCKKY